VELRLRELPSLEEEEKRGQKPRDNKVLQKPFQGVPQGRELSEELIDYVIKHETSGLGTSSDTTHNIYTTEEGFPQRPSAG